MAICECRSDDDIITFTIIMTCIILDTHIHTKQIGIWQNDINVDKKETQRKRYIMK
jgi:hypothetical protein